MRRLVTSPIALVLLCLASSCDDREVNPIASSQAAGGAAQTGAAGSSQAGSSQAGSSQAGSSQAGSPQAGGQAAASGASGKGGGSAEPPEAKVPRGDVCEDPKRATFDMSPAAVYLEKGASRTVKITISPDFCRRMPVSLSIADQGVAVVGPVGGAVPDAGEAASKVAKIDYGQGPLSVSIKGVDDGKTSLTVSMTVGGKPFQAELPITVQSGAVGPCAGAVSGAVAPGGALVGGAGLGFAEVGLQDRADQPVQVEVSGTLVGSPTLWPVSGFDASIGCGADVVPAGHRALGPAITFGPAAKAFPRELPMAIPINPASMPDGATLRHVRVAYVGPAHQAPRVVPVADMRVEALPSGGAVLRFMAPRLGTYQAVIDEQGGKRAFKRRLSHRALVGISMGGGGTAQFGMKHHDRFDVLAPLGGPVDWSYMMPQIENNHLAGFAANDGESVPVGPPQMPKARYLYEHPSMYDAWWYEYPYEGTSPSFPRSSYVQIFRDLALMYGNPVSENEEVLQLPRGVPRSDMSVQGEHTNDDCLVWVDPIGGHPDRDHQRELANKCPAERCAHPLRLTGYFDGRYNPKGKWPVITFCDGAPQIPEKSPYANTWSPEGNDHPVEVGLAVDYNDNGVRDENEPVIFQGHEPFADTGPDGLSSQDEPGYQPGVNEDPAGDDYDPQYNPTGTERNGRHDDGEPFDDVGLDGVMGTKASPYDKGEGDGVFNQTSGLSRFYAQDARSIAMGKVTPPGGALDEAALRRLDVWTDGGTRDLFNFAVAAQTLSGGFASRGKAVTYFTDVTRFPGQPADTPGTVVPQRLRYDELPGVVFYRYGKNRPDRL